jgi:hypothetical protein
MAQLKNVHLLNDFREADIDKMEHAALQHKRYSNIDFKIVEYSPRKVIIQIGTGKECRRQLF